MATHHHHSSRCCCSHRCTTPQPPPPPPLADPFVVQSIVSQVVLLLQNPQIGPFPTPPPPFDLHHQPRPKQKQPLQDEEHPFHSQYSALLQRIHLLESSINRFSSYSSSSSSLRHVAARTIQIHFRAHLVRRSAALRELKELASIKSALNLLKSSFSLHNPPHFVSFSRDSRHLIRRLDAIKSADQMVRDSKISITRDIASFLELVDELCTKRNAFESKKKKTVKPVGMVRNEDKSRVSCAGRRDESSGPHRRGNKASKHRNNLETGEKRLVDNLRQRVERIHHMSKFLQEEEEEDSDDDVRGNNSNYTDRCPRGDLVGKRSVQPHAERRVWFPEDGNATRVCDIHEDGEVPIRRVSGVMERREKSVDDKQREEDGEEVESDSEENDVESGEDSQGKDEAQNASLEGSSQGSEAEEVTTKCLTDESSKKVNVRRLILSAPPPVKMEG